MRKGASDSMKQKHATVRDIAIAAGVSTTTAFRALNEEGTVREETRNKVLAARDLLETQLAGDIPPRRMNEKSIGIIMPAATAQDIGRHPSMFVTLSNFLAELAHYGIDNSMIVLDENVTGADLVRQGKNGYFIMGTSEEQESIIVPALSRAAIPCVFVNRQSDLPYMSNVSIDDIAACANATQHLIDLGHRQIAFLGGSRNYQNTKLRVQGYRQALRTAGIPENEELVCFGEYTELSGYAMGEKLLKMTPIPTAAVCASDPIALGCMRRMEQAGVRVPEDFSIIGFGNIESSRTSSPPLSTVFQRSVEVGQIAARILVQMIDMPIMVSQKVLLQTEMVIRDSTARPKGQA